MIFGWSCCWVTLSLQVPWLRERERERVMLSWRSRTWLTSQDPRQLKALDLEDWWSETSLGDWHWFEVQGIHHPSISWSDWWVWWWESLERIGDEIQMKVFWGEVALEEPEKGGCLSYPCICPVMNTDEGLNLNRCDVCVWGWSSLNSNLEGWMRWGWDRWKGLSGSGFRCFGSHDLD